jgi:hypothetical protein
MAVCSGLAVSAEVEERTGGARTLDEDPLVAVDRREEIREARDRLGISQHEKAVGFQGVVEEGKNAFLEHGLEINEEVPAADQVDVRERGIERDVLTREDANVAHPFGDLPAGVDLREEALLTLGRHVGHGVLQIDSGTRFLDRGLRNVRREDLNRRIDVDELQRLHENDRDRVDLFAGRAAGNPDADRQIRRPLLQDPGENQALEALEDFGVAKERRDRDEDVLVEGTNLGRVLLEHVDVLLDALDLLQGHPAGDAALNRRLTIIREVDAGRGPDQGEDLPVLGGVDRRFFLVRPEDRPHVGMPAHSSELLGDLFGWKNEVDRAGGDGGVGHVVELGRVLLLGEGQTPFCLDRPKTQRPVRHRARENDPDRPCLVLLGERAHEVVDRELAAALARPRVDPERTVDQGNLRVGGNHIDVVRLNAHPAPDLEHAHGRRAAEDLLEHAFALGIEVLDEDVRHARVWRQVLEKLREGLESARGRADADDRKSITTSRRPGPGRERGRPELRATVPVRSRARGSFSSRSWFFPGRLCHDPLVRAPTDHGYAFDSESLSRTDRLGGGRTSTLFRRRVLSPSTAFSSSETRFSKSAARLGRWRSRACRMSLWRRATRSSSARSASQSACSTPSSSAWKRVSGE